MTESVVQIFQLLQAQCQSPYPGEPIPVPDHPFGEENFPEIQPTSPLVQLEAIPPSPNTSYEGEGADPHHNLLPGSCREQ